MMSLQESIGWYNTKGRSALFVPSCEIRVFSLFLCAVLHVWKLEATDVIVVTVYNSAPHTTESHGLYRFSLPRSRFWFFDPSFLRLLKLNLLFLQTQVCSMLCQFHGTFGELCRDCSYKVGSVCRFRDPLTNRAVCFMSLAKKERMVLRASTGNCFSAIVFNTIFCSPHLG